ncbi:MAG: MBL fold metallo-hydrolase [Burkholderiales bacterium]|nr:MAG: MBL fold metallo-hydrolase [Burkholderiales bacterium]
MSRLARDVRHWGDGIFAVDPHNLRAEFDAVHLVIESDRAAIIDSGTNHSTPGVLAALDALGVAREHVDWVILTHVHLDHAGGAGSLMQALPNARMTVHPRGARHMIDPSRLWQATCAVYGEAHALRLYGQIVPVDADRVLETSDGATVTLAGRTFEFLDTPGHARHHVVIRDTATGHLFAGDTFGISYREFDVDGRAFIFPSSTPSQFDPGELHRSLDRMLALAPEAVYMTHYSQVRDIPRLGEQLRRMIDRFAEIAMAEADAGEARQANIEQAMTALLFDAARAHGFAGSDAEMQALLANDLRLNSAGLIDWLEAGR